MVVQGISTVGMFAYSPAPVIFNAALLTGTDVSQAMRHSEPNPPRPSSEHSLLLACPSPFSHRLEPANRSDDGGCERDQS